MVTIQDVAKAAGVSPMTVSHVINEHRHVKESTRAKVLATLERYNVDYVVVGRVELAKYPQETLPPFETFLDLVFESGELRIYAVPAMKVVPTS